MKKYCILLIIVFGFFITPNSVFACGMKCCAKETTITKVNKGCCEKSSDSKEKSHDGCGKKCPPSSCKCPVFHNSIVMPFDTILKSMCFNFSTKKKLNLDDETNLSSGFHSLWLIPKIS